MLTRRDQERRRSGIANRLMPTSSNAATGSGPRNHPSLVFRSSPTETHEAVITNYVGMPKSQHCRRTISVLPWHWLTKATAYGATAHCE
jgi:hypothetical protein